jgi:hypothetical protein
MPQCCEYEIWTRITGGAKKPPKKRRGKRRNLIFSEVDVLYEELRAIP